MALSVVATLTTAYGVRLLVDGGTPPYVVDASPGGDRPDYRVRTVYATVAGSPNARVGVDGDAPLNVPVVYVATDAGGAQAQTAAPVTVVSSSAILSDATDPGRALAVTVRSQKPNTWEARSVWWDVLGASAPFASIAPMRYRNGPLVLRVPNPDGRASMVNLLRPGSPLVLRSVTPRTVDDLTILVESVEEALTLVEDPSGPVEFTLQYQAISTELGPTVTDPGRSYATVKAESATYAIVRSKFPTYEALRVGIAGGSLGPELVTGGDFSAGLAAWDTAWTTADTSWSTAGGTAKATTAGTGPGISRIASAGANDDVVTPGTRYRISGRVRSSHASTVLTVEVLTNTSPDVAGYFQPGVALQAPGLPSSGTWAPFSLDVTIPAGDDRWAVWFSGAGMVNTAVVEWDDLSIRSLT